MKRFIFLLTAIFICTIAYAHTINWHVGNTILETTTCDSGDSITPPTAPYKYGYHFTEWAGYTPIEYLESTGTQWIDTGWNAPNGCKVDMKIMLSTLPNNLYAIIGSHNQHSPWGRNYLLFYHIPPDRSIRDFFEIGAGGYKDVGFGKTGVEYNISFSTIPNNIYFNDTNVSNLTDAQTTRNSNNLYLFNVNGYSFNKFIGRIYYLKIWDSNDILVRDFIPVLDKNGTPCMYDRVEKKFYYNAGTGQFIAGPVIGE